MKKLQKDGVDSSHESADIITEVQENKLLGDHTPQTSFCS